MMKCNSIICTLLLSLLLAGLCSAQHHRVDEPIPEELHEAVMKRADAINKEQASLKSHEWAGVYLQGDHHPTMLYISPQNGFVVTASEHSFYPSWVNFGKVEYINGRIRFLPEMPKGNRSTQEIPTEYLVIKWDGQRHLVLPNQLINFAYDVHSRSGSASVDYFTRSTEADPKGLPDLPKEYLKYIRMKPITARAVSVSKDDVTLGTVVIDAGRSKGVIKGMSFFLIGQKQITATLWVDKVFEDRAECSVAGFGTDGEAPENLWLRPGWRFSSRMPKELF